MGEGACSLAMEMSDITFMDSNLRKLPFSLELGRTVVTIIRENIAISVVSKLVIGVLTFYNSMTLLLAIASDIGIMLFVTLNGMRPLRKSSNVSKTKQRWVNKHVAYNQLEVVDQE
jgi:Cd2+/Zn2+-exporting ATPase